MNQRASRSQLAALGAGLLALGYSTAEDRRSFLRSEVGRDVDTPAELTVDEADALLGRIRAREVRPAGGVR